VTVTMLSLKVGVRVTKEEVAELYKAIVRVSPLVPARVKVREEEVSRRVVIRWWDTVINLETSPNNTHLDWRIGAIT